MHNIWTAEQPYVNHISLGLCGGKTMICIEQEPSVFDCAPSQLSEPTLQKQIQKQFGMAQILEKMGPVCSSLGFGVKSKA